MTFGGAYGFQITATSDLTTTFTITVVSSGGSPVSSSQSVEGSEGTVFLDYQVPFSTFAGVDFTKIVAIQIEIDAKENVDFILESFATYGDANVVSQGGSSVSGQILPCTADYYRVQTLTGLTPGNYIRIHFNQSGEAAHPNDLASFYIVGSSYSDLPLELKSNLNIIDTLGQLPGEKNYLYSCKQVESCDIEITCELEETTYYIAIIGGDEGWVNYEFEINLRAAPVFELFDCAPQPVLNDRRADQPPDDHTLYYRFFAIDIPQGSYTEGSYLVVNISRADPLPLELRLAYAGLPGSTDNAGVWNVVDFDSNGNQVDDCTYQFCVDTTGSDYVHPVNTDPRVPCVSTTTYQEIYDDGPFQLTTKLTVDPCAFQYGTWYAAVLLPARANVTDPLDISGNVNYTITACVVSPVITQLERNITFKGYVEPELQTHYKIVVPEEDVVEGETHLLIQVSNIRNGYVDIWVHSDIPDSVDNLAGGPEGCLPANATCHSCDACNIVIEKCHFAPGTWYISFSIGVDANGEFEITDYDRLPITYTLRADWMEDSAPISLLSGVPVSRYIGASLYDFYVIDIPPTVDTWLFVELFTKACDTEVILSVLHGSLPGGECYDRPDFYCLTGDSRDLTYTSHLAGQFPTYVPPTRESCTFMIQTCELEAGPLYLSVYGHRLHYEAYGDTTYYQIPAHYTLFVDFDTAQPVQSALSYTETVYENQYKHYYIRADQILEGSYMSVEVTNILHGIPQTVEVFVNYNYLAGDCPCYENLYNATGARLPGCNNVLTPNEPNYLPKPNTVAGCATIIVPACDFRPGVWYIAVLGVNQDLAQYTTPIGYTLTVTVHDAPIFNPLILGQSTPSVAPQWNKTLEYTHFKLAASPIPLSDLVIKITYVQNCEYQAKHDNLRDQLVLFVNADGPAGDKCYDYTCTANIQSESYCTVVVPSCEWQSNDYFVAVKGDYDAVFPGRFTIRASIEDVRTYQLTSGVSIYDRVSVGRYKHYFIVSTGTVSKYLAVDFYSNNDQDLVSVYLNVHEPAGAEPCYTNTASCISKNSCSFQVETCDIEAGRYYISVYGSDSQFYDISTEYTLTASLRTLTTAIEDGNPLTGSIKAGGVLHYQIEVDQVSEGDFLTFEIDNVQHGSVVVYYQYESVAGRCPCYLYEQSCYADSDGTEWCEIRVPSCEFATGKHFFSIVGLKNKSPSALKCSTPIGFTIEANIIRPNIIEPTFALGRNTDNTEFFQFVANGRYNHYKIDFTQDDWLNGYHTIVEITSVRDGALFVYFTPDFPGDEDTDCHLAKICTSGLGSGKSCYWQVPFSLTKPRVNPENPSRYDTTLYITVEGRTGRLQASYNILIYKQPVPAIIANQEFTLDNVTSSFFFPQGTEVNVTHSKVNEPNGWTQFIRLSDVLGHSDPLEGEILEVFFYRIVNNFLEPMAFNVYIYPNYTAGAHECCDSLDSNLGSCQGAPRLNTVELSTQVIPNGPEVLTHTCNVPAGSGVGPTSEPFYGSYCIARVWPCEFNRYCPETADWWVAVVPIAPTDPSSTPLQGLSYSVQYRTRNIRLNEEIEIDSIPLLEYVNSYEDTPDYYVESFTTESEGWLSFILDFSAQPFVGKLSIQTHFINGTSVVYINPDRFASPPTDFNGVAENDCATYYCASNDASTNCDQNGRFVVTACDPRDVYFITVRNIGGPQTISTVRFRIVAIYEDVPVAVPFHTFESNKFVATSGRSIIANITGVEGENYDFYTFAIDDGDIDDYESFIIDLSRNNSTDTGVLNVYVRLGSLAGDYSGSSLDFYSDPEACYSYEYACTGINNPGRCIFQIPHTILTQGFYSVSVYNPNFDLELPVNLPDYSISLYLQTPTTISLDVPFVETNASYAYRLPGTYTHFVFDVTEADIAFSTQTEDNYYTRWLRVELDGITSTAGIQLYLNYDDLAGAPGTFSSSLDYIHSVTCGSTGSCYIDVLPCDDFNLKTGKYFVALYLNAATTYNLTASILTESYDKLVPVAEPGTGKRSGLTDYVWTASPTVVERDAAGDGYGYYRYVVNTADSQITDLTNYFFYVNVSIANINNTVTDEVYVDIWRNDCSRFTTSVVGADNYRVIDALTLAPCSVQGGIFWIRVYSPSNSLFIVDFYESSVFIQTLLDTQVFVEQINPYEYDEYFYQSQGDVHQGATLSVKICALCGEVEAWIRPDLPAGPGPDATGYEYSCGLDHCTATSADDEDDFYFDDEDDDSCCILFLDTCQYEQRGYYIAVRGVGTTYPNLVNEHIYLPAKYQIQATQTNVQVHDVSFSCASTVEYQQTVNHVPQQYAVDLESSNVGAQLRFSMVLPTQYVLAPNSAAILSVSWNRTAGYTSACENLPYTCSVYPNSGYSCEFIIPSCSVHPGRYYIWADAPRGTEILVERWDPVIPIIHTDIQYHATINGPVSGIEVPFTPATQYYRFDYPDYILPDDDDDFDHFYDKFFVRVRVSEVTHGSISVILNTGYAPYNPNDSNCAQPVFFNVDSCTIATDGYDCRIDIERSDIAFVENEYPVPPKTFWITVLGTEQQCELHSIQYSFTVQTQWVLTYFDVDTTICESVQEDEYNFHRLRPHKAETPQQSYLNFHITDIDAVLGEEVELLIQDNYMPTLDTATFSIRSGRASSSVDVVPEGEIDANWYCSYENLYFSVYGINSADGPQGDIDYRINVTKVFVDVKQLTNNHVYHADDDDDDACPHEHDFYIFKAIAPKGGYKSAFLRVAVTSDSDFEVYVNKEGFAWEQCHVAHGTAERGTLNLYDFCGYEDTTYYITVISNGPYYIFTNVIDDSTELTLGQVYRDHLEKGQYQMYTLEVCKDWLAPDDRLVVEIADVQGANVYGWIQRDSNPGPYQSPEGDGVCDITGSSAVALFGASETGYNFLLVDHCDLTPGTYHILIRAEPYQEDDTDAALLLNDDDDRSPEEVTYRLLPRLEKYGVEIANITLGVSLSDSVDFYTIDRAEAGSTPFVRYYKVNPAISGYENGLSFAQIRLSNVQGGLLRLRAQRERLASAPSGYIPGTIRDLTHNYLIHDTIQSGHRPYTYQPIIDPRFSQYQDCDGCTDFCVSMSYDDSDEYIRDKSASLVLSSCYWDLAFPFYVAVEATTQFYEDVSITFDIQVDQYHDFTLLQPNINHEASMTNDNWETHSYRAIQAEVESARWRVVVVDGEGVLVTVRNHRCPLQATWTREVWCDADYFDRPWMCDIEIPTAAAHPGNNAFFVSVYGKNATYSIAYWRGRENCHDFYGAGYTDGLDFCAGLVPYTTWRWDDYSKLDNEAQCFFEELYGHFRVQPCWSGVTTDCNATLQRFACYESFRRCDEYGFYVGTCRKACNAVVYECVNWFESVNLEHYNCSSSRYIDEGAYTCTGSEEFETFTPGTANLFFPADPKLILYNPDLEVNGASFISLSAALVALVALLFL